jgi:ATP-dependent Clp protease ATP-binding subunit ClpA
MRSPLPASLRAGLEERRTWYRLTGRALRALSQAHAEAARLGSGTLEPVHLALGLTLVPEGVAAVVLRRLGVDVDRLRRGLEDGGASRGSEAAARDPRGSNEFWIVLSRAFAFADDHNTPWVGTEHLMESVLDASSPCAHSLAHLGVTAAAYAEELERFFADGRIPGAAEGS